LRFFNSLLGAFAGDDVFYDEDMLALDATRAFHDQDRCSAGVSNSGSTVHGPFLDCEGASHCVPFSTNWVVAAIPSPAVAALQGLTLPYILIRYISRR
jgi:hypothetical protein